MLVDVPDKVAEWLQLFATQNADPLMMLGVRPDGVPVFCAVKTIEGGKSFDMRQMLTDVLLRMRGE